MLGEEHSAARTASRATAHAVPLSAERGAVKLFPSSNDGERLAASRGRCVASKNVLRTAAAETAAA